MGNAADQERRLHGLFREGWELPPPERRIWIEALRKDDPDTADRVEALFTSDSDLLEPEDLRRSPLWSELVDDLRNDPPNQPPAQRVGHYRILRELGRGGMAIVYLAERDDGAYDQQVALKVMRRGLAGEAAELRFRQERQILATLQHPNIARLLDGGVTPDGLPYLAMEYVDGQPIDVWVETHETSLQGRLALLLTICDALAHAHRRLIVHRDLKPKNLLVADDGTPHLLDFGIAKLLEPKSFPGASTETQTGLHLLTPSYASPEQVRGEPIGTSSDVYQLGLLLYELLTGQRAQRVAGLGPSALEHTICEREPMRPSLAVDDPGVRRRLRGDLDWITMRALEKDPARRYPSPAEFAADIRRHLADEPVAAGPPSTAYRASKFVRRHTFGVVSVVIVSALLVGFAVTTAVQARRIAGERDRVELARADLERVARFQADMLSEVDPKTVGRVLADDVRAQLEEATRARGLSDFEAARFLDALDASMQEINLTNTALRVVDENILRQAVAAIDERFGDSPVIDARLRVTIADTYRELGLLERAETLFLEALETRRRELGDEDPLTLDTMNRLATVYRSQGRYDEAEPLLVETYEIKRRVLGEEHQDTLEAGNGLAILYWRQARYADAEPLYLGILETRRRVFGNDSLATLHSMNNLASLYWSQGKYDLAEPLLAESLAAKKRTLGDEDPDTLSSLNNLATVYRAQGRLDEAEPLLVEALETKKRVLGDEHRSTLTTMTNLALLYRNALRYEAAEQVILEALEIQRRILGYQHPDTINTRVELAHLYGVSQERYEEGERLAVEALDDAREVLGDEHPETLSVMNTLSTIYWNRGRQHEAESLLKETLAIKRRVLGDEDPKTLNSLFNLADLYRKQSRFDKAEPLIRDTLEARVRILGADHPRTLKTRYALALVCHEQGRFDEERPLLAELLDERTRKLGEDHAHTLEVVLQLARLEVAQGNLAAALDRLRQVVAAGFTDADSLTDDPGLEPLHDHPEFVAVVEHARQAAPTEPTGP